MPFFTTAAGYRVAYDYEPEAAQTVVLVHGFPLDRTMWDDRFRARPPGHAYLRLDLPGFGESERPAGYGPLTMEAHAGVVAEVVDSLVGGPVTLVGLSMGGYVALALFAARPDLIAGLVLCDTKAAADTTEGKAGREAAVERLLSDGKDAWGAGLAGALLAPDATVEARARLREMIARTSYPTIVAALLGMRDRPDRSRLLDEIDVPGLVIVGAADALTPPATAAAMADRMPRAGLAVIDGAGHLPPIERPAEFSAALAAFLDGSP